MTLEVVHDYLSGSVESTSAVGLSRTLGDTREFGMEIVGIPEELAHNEIAQPWAVA